MNSTTRMFSRTLSEAFPPEVDSGIEHEPQSIFSTESITVGEVLLWVISCSALASLMFFTHVWDWVVRMAT